MKSFAPLLSSLMLIASAAAPAFAAEQAAAAKPDLAKGQEISTNVCGACHTADGSRGSPANPILQGQHPEYLAKQLTEFKAGKRVNAIMQGMAANLTPADMKAVGEYFFSQRPKTMAIARDKDLALKGQKIYRAGIAAAKVPACAGCHGGAGAGIPANYPRLAGQWPDYALAALNNYASGERKHPVMNEIASRLKPAEMQAVAEYLAGMRTN